MSESQVGTHAATGDGCISIGLDTLPKRDGAAGSYAIVLNHVAMNNRHALIVLLVNSLKFFGCKDIVERYVQLNILHIRCDGVYLHQQLGWLFYFRGIYEQGFDKSVGRDGEWHVGAVL